MILAMIFRRNPGRDLQKIGARKQRKLINETTRQLRRELGLPDHPALRG